MASSAAETTSEVPRHRWPTRSLQAGMWFFAILAVLSIAAWCISARWTVGYKGRSFKGSAGLQSGNVYYWRLTEVAAGEGQPPDTQWEWQWVRRETPMSWWWGYFFAPNPGGVAVVWFPIWMIALGNAAGAAACRGLLLWLDRCDRRGCCHGCGYPSTGLPAAAVCPECGRDA
ncbi:MAG: hypothetical protein KF745_12335 [Phycisphaeraceae bacterium]|nr:hypothetical protein [Phycisphaeraceae bacterium]